MTSYRVTAPYVTLKIRDQSGKFAINGFYAGAVVSDDQVEKESLKRHLDRKMVEKVTAASVKPAKKTAAQPEKESPRAESRDDA